jgi:hypothetical protein
MRLNSGKAKSFLPAPVCGRQGRQARSLYIAPVSKPASRMTWGDECNDANRRFSAAKTLRLLA